MSFVVASPKIMTDAATSLAILGSVVRAANAAAAAPTTGLIPRASSRQARNSCGQDPQRTNRVARRRRLGEVMFGSPAMPRVRRGRSGGHLNVGSNRAAGVLVLGSTRYLIDRSGRDPAGLRVCGVVCDGSSRSSPDS
ncbi:PE domain-containing protein [Mycobacterium montefiorense]|uniref:PE domain-containing protein n=1 Tax=Mycobacterium montefiorense TaxID=154654 RepID=UPI0021F269CD|nr:PE domain-containing protein [Mycobacterium montefiorense]MCV7425401.1 PE family protein [Mycobacterium montefiorense]